MFKNKKKKKNQKKKKKDELRMRTHPSAYILEVQPSLTYWIKKSVFCVNVSKVDVKLLRMSLNRYEMQFFSVTKRFSHDVNICSQLITDVYLYQTI